MKTKLYVALVLIAIVSLFALAPGCPPTEPPPIETEPPEETEPPPEVTEKPKGPPEVTENPGHGNEEPTAVVSGKGGGKAEPREIRLPAGGYGPVQRDGYYWLRWFMLALVGITGVWLAAWSLKR